MIDRDAIKELVTLHLPSLELLKEAPLPPSPETQFGVHIGSFENGPEASLSSCGGTLVLRGRNGMRPETRLCSFPLEAVCTTCGFAVPLEDHGRHGWEAAIVNWMHIARSCGLYFAMRDAHGPEGLKDLGYHTSAWFSLSKSMPELDAVRNESALDHCPSGRNEGSHKGLLPHLRKNVAVAAMPQLSTLEGAQRLFAISAVLERRTPAHIPAETSVKAILGLNKNARNEQSTCYVVTGSYRPVAPSLGDN